MRNATTKRVELSQDAHAMLEVSVSSTLAHDEALLATLTEAALGPPDDVRAECEKRIGTLRNLLAVLRAAKRVEVTF